MLDTSQDVDHSSILALSNASVITVSQLRAARALIGIDQRELAALCGLSVPTIQRMEASGGVIRGTVDSLMKLVHALDAAGIEIIAEGAISNGGGRGVRLKAEAPRRRPKAGVRRRRAKR